ncbi:MAG: GC-type dockerin domain-anchored protein [Phycisphaerales bacterium]
MDSAGRHTVQRPRAISFDPDGPGGAPPQLIAAGAFTLANSARGVARWDGATWQPMGTGIAFENTTGVTSLAVFDPDGTGPLPARLIAAGFFSTGSGAPGNSVVQWDGVTWSALGTQAFGTLRKVAVFDPDGEGPAQQLLIACSDSSLSQPSPVLGWDGATWRELTAPVYHSQVLSYGTFDPDGDGPRPPVLVVGGNLQQTGRYAATHIMAFGCSEAIDVPPPCSPADIGSTGGQVGSDDLLNNNDFIAFITLFFIEDARVDFGSAGGVPGADGQFDNNDFIAFINYFFTGCQ